LNAGVAPGGPAFASPGFTGLPVALYVYTPRVDTRESRDGNLWAFTSYTQTALDVATTMTLSTFESGDGPANARCTTTTYATGIASGVAVDRPASTQLRSTDCNGPVVSETRATYDAASGLPLTSTVENGATDITTSTTYEPATFRRPLSIRDGRDKVSTITYSNTSWGQPMKVRTTNPLGHTQVLEPDERGAVVRSTDAHQHVTRGEYDALGRLLRVFKPLDGATPSVAYSYELVTNNDPNAFVHAPSRVTTTTMTNTGGGMTKSVSFIDGLGRTIETQTQSGSGRIVTLVEFSDEGRQYRTFEEFPASGVPGSTYLSGSDPNVTGWQVASWNGFDGFGRVVASQDHVNGIGLVSQTATSYWGRATTVQPPVSGRVITEVDAFGRSTRTTNYGTGEATPRVVSTAYDVRDLVVSSGTVNATTGYLYDPAGRQIRVVDPNSGTTWYEYDANGNTTRRFDAKAQDVWTTYDDLNRPVSRTAGGALAASWTYDTLRAGLLTSSTSHEWDGAYTTQVLGYDDRDRPTGTRYTLPTGEVYDESIGGYTSLDQPTSMTYGAFGGLPAETVTNTYDNLGRPVGMSSPAATYVGNVGYDSLNRVVSRSLGAGDVVRTYGYDNRRRLETMVASHAGQTIQNDLLSYDVESRITAIDHRAGLVHKECFELDGASRLTRGYTVASGWGCAGAMNTGLDATLRYDQRWQHSSEGNITRRDDFDGATTRSVQYQYGPGPNRLTGYGTTQFSYDANGARTGSSTPPVSALRLVPLSTPTRLLDTRTGGAPVIGVGGTVAVGLTPASVPADAEAVMVNIVAVSPTGPGSISAWPEGGLANSVPRTITPGTTINNLTVVGLSAADRFVVQVNGSAMHVIVDIVGYYVSTTTATTDGRVIASGPTRVYDSRPPNVPLGAGQFRRVSAASAGLPADAVAVIATVAAFNVTAPSGWLSVLPNSAVKGSPPTTASLNMTAGTARANQVAVFVPLDQNREFTVYSSVQTDFTVDVVGYVTGPASPAGENGLFRVLPSPVSMLSAPTAAGQSHLVTVAGSGGVVDTLSMVTGVVSLQNTSGVRQFATVEAANASGVPAVSSVNVGPNERLAGYATSRVSNGQVRVYASGPGTVTFDVVGYYVSVLSMGPQDQYRGPSGYAWNAEQHLESTTAPDGVTRYSYDVGGQRVALRSPNGEVTYSLGAMEATRTAGGWVRVRRGYAHAGVTVASRELGVGGNRLSWLLGNHQGSLTTTVTGGVVSTRAYAPYGGRRGPLPVERPTSTGFVGQREDTSSGLSYLNARYHDPVTGSFVSVDPLVAKTGEPYLYASGNPITLSDPSGLTALPGGEWMYETGGVRDSEPARQARYNAANAVWEMLNQREGACGSCFAAFNQANPGRKQEKGDDFGFFKSVFKSVLAVTVGVLSRPGVLWQPRALP
jgi:RHS repeat-associated protein